MGDLLSPNGTVIAKVKLLSPRGNNCKVLFNNKVDKQNFYSFLTTEYSNKFRTLALLYQENLIDKNEWLQEQNNIAAGYCLYLYDKQYPKKLCDFTAQAKAIWAQHERELKKIKKIAKPTPVNSIKTLEKIAFTPHKHRVDPLLPIPFNYSKPKESKILFSSKLYDTEGIFVGAVEKKKTTRALFSIVFANEQAKSLLMQEVHEADYSNDVWSGFKGKTRIKEANLISHYLNFIYLSQFPAK